MLVLATIAVPPAFFFFSRKAGEEKGKEKLTLTQFCKEFPFSVKEFLICRPLYLPDPWTKLYYLYFRNTVITGTIASQLKLLQTMEYLDSKVS